MKNLLRPLIINVLVVLLVQSTSLEGALKNKDKLFSLNVQNMEIEEVLEIIADKMGLELEPYDVKPTTVSYNFEKISLEKALVRIIRDNNLLYSVEESSLVVSPKVTNRSIASQYSKKSEGENAPNLGESSNSKTASSFEGKSMSLIKINYISANEMADKIKPMLALDDKISVDKESNAIAIFSQNNSLKDVRSLVEAFDRMPEQIYIEAIIVEVTKNMAKEFGVSFGELDYEGTDSIKDKHFGFNAPTSLTPTNAFLGLKIGHIGANLLKMKLSAAEASGNAKIISKPQVMTVNNVNASISSGITYHVKTLAGADSAGTDIAGGIQKISAGLNLEVLPTHVGNNHVKLKISVSNSEPEESSAVDGIPGIIDNKATTTIIVKDGQTATMAGLVKNNVSESKTGTPYLSEIPFLGWLFKNKLSRDRDSELMIFITPHLMNQKEGTNAKNLEDLDRLKNKNVEM